MICGFILGGVGFLGNEIVALMGNGLVSSVNHFMEDTVLSSSPFKISGNV